MPSTTGAATISMRATTWKISSPVLDGRVEVVEEVKTAPADVKAFLAEEFRGFLENRGFLDACPGTSCPIKLASSGFRF